MIQDFDPYLAFRIRAFLNPRHIWIEQNASAHGDLWQSEFVLQCPRAKGWGVSTWSTAGLRLDPKKLILNVNHEQKIGHVCSLVNQPKRKL
jgi:hypothetical protein